MSAAELPAWSATERESFFATIARHRRAAWQVSAVAGVCVALLAFVVATLTAPLFYAVIGLVLDVINFVVPMPDLLGTIMDSMSAWSDAPEAMPASRWLYIAFLAALPGLFAVVAILLTLRRIVREAEIGAVEELSPGGDFAASSLCAPDPSVLAEQRLANVVAEMAIAANIKVPNVRILDSDAVNAGVYGADEQTATVLVSSALLRDLDRAQIQGAVAHLIGLIANGDVLQGMRVAQSLSLFGFVARLSDGIVDPQAWTRLWKTLREALRSGASSADARLILELTNPFGGEPTPPAARNSSSKLTWREWIRMPLYGPLVISGFFGGMVSSFVLEPLVAMIWRRRKYMADAIAIQLTRDPQTLCDALVAMRSGERGGGFPAWCAHMLLIGSAQRGGVLSGSSVPMYPSLDRRLKALGRMGASVSVTARRVPGWLWLIIVPAGALVAALMCVAICLLVVVSVMLSMLFTWLPAMVLHALLR